MNFLGGAAWRAGMTVGAQVPACVGMTVGGGLVRVFFDRADSGVIRGVVLSGRGVRRCSGLFRFVRICSGLFGMRRSGAGGWRRG